MNFEWDPKKAAENLRKHKVSFHEATTVFEDVLAVTLDDLRHSEFERRFVTIGMSGAGRLLVVANAERGENLRIISARRATKREQRDYEEKDQG